MTLRHFVEEESKAERLSPVCKVAQLTSSSTGLGPSLSMVVNCVVSASV